MALREKIVIAGFSGSGKSTFLKELKTSAPIDWTHFDDLDDLVFQKYGQGFSNLAQLINQVGWEQFRKWERAELDSWLKLEEKGVLALGGGALSPLVWETYSASRRIEFCVMDADFETCWNRLTQTGAQERPLVQRGKTELFNIFLERQVVFDKIKRRISSDLKLEATKLWVELSR